MNTSAVNCTIAVDTMGGDKGPTEFIRGFLYATEELGIDCNYTFVGNARLIERLLKVRKHSIDPARINIHHTTQVIGMDEKPISALKSKKDSSMVQAIHLVREGHADAMVSCGNTGALMAGGTLRLVKSIVRELGGEKIDIVKYSEDPLELLHEAIRPAVPLNIKVDEENKRIYFEVSEENLSIAIGRRGQNARLTSRLLGWKLDIAKEAVSEVGFDERLTEAIKGWEGVTGISDDLAAFLVQHGLVSPEAFEGVEAKDLVKLGFTEEDADQIVSLVQAHRSASSSDA